MWCYASILPEVWWRRSCTFPIPPGSIGPVLLSSPALPMSTLPIPLPSPDSLHATNPVLRAVPFVFSALSPRDLSTSWGIATLLFCRLSILHRSPMYSCVLWCPHRSAIRIYFPVGAENVRKPVSLLPPSGRVEFDSVAISSEPWSLVLPVFVRLVGHKSCLLF